MSARTTRSQSAKTEQAGHTNTTNTSLQAPPNTKHLRHKTSTIDIQYVNADRLSSLLQLLPREERALLRDKQRKLQDANAQVPTFIRECLRKTDNVSNLLAQAAAATLVFAWEAAGTAVCISPGGLLLTCSHCIAESEDEYTPDTPRWLLLASGHPVQAVCIAWDPQRDLTLLQITIAPLSLSKIPYVRLSLTAPRVKTKLLCIGHPGSEDFEAEIPGVATNYDVLHVSEGRFRGMAKDQDPQNNSEIGALMHDCWTYWGHSGAPLVEKESGMLVGLHSSWDDETAMRRGVGWEAMKTFLDSEVEAVDSWAKV